MASVILPTVEWTASCEQLAEQLEPADELLVVCDSEDDPVASVDLPEESRLLVAGEPEGCSGKANAVALALEHASQDRIVLTDDDVERDEEWLATIKRLGEEHGTVTAIPVFYSEDYPFKLLEPLSIVVASFVVDRMNWVAWGGGLTFDRRDIDLEGYIADLRRTVSDDALLAEYTDDVVASRELISPVRVPGGPRVTYERVTRFVTIFYRFAPRRTLAILGIFLAVVAAGLVAPLLVAVSVTYLARDRYRALDVERKTWPFAVPSLILAPLFGIAGIVRPTFVWGGRRYRWSDTFDVTVVENETE
ncbi:glycosyl transferase [Halobiforma lacisalsi AJ5]|uniref:Glycosyl transferase n=1 Tax=Natronobacterium lacisalsi AJ5 TaxID=358396 RepID=M0LJM7_NATLA|nr:glycosyltransferase [Halobiforma lacisalsi]APW98487.1 glycosyl transferase [Halobiforma lacisalsi AJ5]EMA33268.1 glycosyl transferase family protein [Halobiforma lacisalsi AJ5]